MTAILRQNCAPNRPLVVTTHSEYPAPPPLDPRFNPDLPVAVPMSAPMTTEEQFQNCLAEKFLTLGPLVLANAKRVGLNADDARDVMQESILVAVKAVEDGKADRIADFASWFLIVGHHKALSARRDTKKHAQFSNGDAEELIDLSISEDPVERGEAVALVQKAVGSLPENYRSLIVYCDMEGNTYAEACEQFGLTEGAVRGRLHRARETLRRKLKAYVFMEE